MERKQLIAQRALHFFADSLKDVLRTVQQDREELHGWQEPAHLRAVLRRAAGAREAPPGNNGPVAVAEAGVGQGAGEPGKGEQREALGEILEAGAVALEKLVDSPAPELRPEDVFGLELILLLYARPALQLSQGQLAQPPAFWKRLDEQRDDIELTQRGVGRIELVGHPDYDWAGTAFLVGSTCLMTTRSVTQTFAERDQSGAWQFRPGISAWMNYGGDYQRPGAAAYRIKRVLGMHDHGDLALLEVEPPQDNGSVPTALAVALEAPASLVGRPVYLIGYPVGDARRNEPENVARIFRDVYNVKRVHPGKLCGIERFGDTHLLRHDCAPLGHSSGACLVDLETHQVLGLHVSGRYLENGTAVPLWLLHDDPLLERCQVTLAQAPAEEMSQVSSQIARLARTRRWTDVRDAVAKIYEQAFGNSEIEKIARPA